MANINKPPKPKAAKVDAAPEPVKSAAASGGPIVVDASAWTGRKDKAARLADAREFVEIRARLKENAKKRTEPLNLSATTDGEQLDLSKMRQPLNFDTPEAAAPKAPRTKAGKAKVEAAQLAANEAARARGVAVFDSHDSTEPTPVAAPSEPEPAGPIIHDPTRFTGGDQEANFAKIKQTWKSKTEGRSFLKGLLGKIAERERLQAEKIAKIQAEGPKAPRASKEKGVRSAPLNFSEEGAPLEIPAGAAMLDFKEKEAPLKQPRGKKAQAAAQAEAMAAARASGRAAFSEEGAPLDLSTSASVDFERNATAAAAVEAAAVAKEAAATAANEANAPREMHDQMLAEKYGMGESRTAFQAADRALAERKLAFAQKHKSWFARQFMGRDGGEQAEIRQLEAERNHLMEKYEQDLEKSVRERLLAKGKDEAYIEKALGKYQGIIRYNEIVKPAFENDIAIRLENQSMLEKNLFKKMLGGVVKFNQNLEKFAGGPKRARAIRSLATVLAVTGLAAGGAALGLSATLGAGALVGMGAYRFSKSFLIGTVLGGTALGRIAGETYKAKIGRKGQAEAKEKIKTVGRRGTLTAADMKRAIDERAKLDFKSKDSTVEMKAALMNVGTSFLTGVGAGSLASLLDIPDIQEAIVQASENAKDGVGNAYEHLMVPPVAVPDTAPDHLQVITGEAPAAEAVPPAPGSMTDAQPAPVEAAPAPVSEIRPAAPAAAPEAVPAAPAAAAPSAPETSPAAVPPAPEAAPAAAAPSTPPERIQAAPAPATSPEVIQSAPPAPEATPAPGPVQATSPESGATSAPTPESGAAAQPAAPETAPATTSTPSEQVAQTGIAQGEPFQYPSRPEGRYTYTDSDLNRWQSTHPEAVLTQDQAQYVHDQYALGNTDPDLVPMEAPAEAPAVQQPEAPAQPQAPAVQPQSVPEAPAPAPESAGVVHEAGWNGFVNVHPDRIEGFSDENGNNWIQGGGDSKEIADERALKAMNWVVQQPAGTRVYTLDHIGPNGSLAPVAWESLGNGQMRPIMNPTIDTPQGPQPMYLPKTEMFRKPIVLPQ